MHVLAADEDLLEHGLVGDERHDPQLDLRVVGADEDVAGRRLEAAADLATELGPHRHVLQVGVGRREPAGGRSRLHEGRVDARLGVGQLRQHVEVGLHELVELTPALDRGDDLVLCADRLQHARVGREAGLAAALARQAELVEQDRAKLLGRPDRELLAGQAEDLALEVGDLVQHACADQREALLVEPHAGDLHVAQHRDERQLDLVHQAGEAAVVELLALPGGQRLAECGGGREGSDASVFQPALLADLGEREAATGGLQQVGGQQQVVREVGSGPCCQALAS